MKTANEWARERKQITAKWSRELEAHISGLAELRDGNCIPQTQKAHLEELIELARAFLSVFNKLDDEVSRISKQAAVGAALLEVLRDHSDDPALAWKAFVQSETDRLDP